MTAKTEDYGGVIADFMRRAFIEIIGKQRFFVTFEGQIGKPADNKAWASYLAARDAPRTRLPCGFLLDQTPNGDPECELKKGMKYLRGIQQIIVSALL